MTPTLLLGAGGWGRVSVGGLGCEQDSWDQFSVRYKVRDST